MEDIPPDTIPYNTIQSYYFSSLTMTPAHSNALQPTPRPNISVVLLATWLGHWKVSENIPLHPFATLSQGLPIYTNNLLRFSKKAIATTKHNDDNQVIFKHTNLHPAEDTKRKRPFKQQSYISGSCSPAYPACDEDQIVYFVYPYRANNLLRLLVLYIEVWQLYNDVYFGYVPNHG